MGWWNDFWTWAENSQLGANVVGGLLVALIVALVGLIITLARSNLRKKIWGGIGRALKRMSTIRLTTTDRIEKEYERGVDEGWAGHEREVAEEAAAQEAEAKKPGVKIRYDLPPLDPALPLPQPRWRITRQPDGSFEILNLMPRSVAREVHIEGDSDFMVTSAGHWEDMSGQNGAQFTGDANYTGRTRGVNFAVTWYDERNAQQQSTVNLGPWERIEGDVWQDYPTF